LKAKEIVCKIFKTMELWSLWSFGRHKPEAVGFCLYLSLIIRGVSRGGLWKIVRIFAEAPRMSKPRMMGEGRKRKQIPFGNDKQKAKTKYRGPSLRSG
jgi:hypothetical protein